MQYDIKNIAAIVDGKVLQLYRETMIEHLLTDSRKVYSSSTSLFFALKGLVAMVINSLLNCIKEGFRILSSVKW